MKPPKKKEANIQEILKHPVKSNKQKPLQYKKEGFWGWFSYVAWMLTVPLFFVFLTDFIMNFFDYSNDFINNYRIFLFGAGILGIVLSLITIIKSPYKMGRKVRNIFLILFTSTTFVFELITITEFKSIILPLNIMWFVGMLYLFFLIWYVQFFFKKSKDGYRLVCLKVLLFTLVPFLPFLIFENSIFVRDGLITSGTYLEDDVEF